ncbi:MAG: ribose-phosphate pyrophosphokinase [Patescibacteria group bacterium]
MEHAPIALISGTANPTLARKIAAILGEPLAEPISRFLDGEIRVKGLPNLRGRSVFIIQPTSPPVNDHLMELTLMIDAARRASAKEITAVIPYFGYARQDRKELPRVPISASVVANIIATVGTSRILTVDIHTEQSQGFVQCPWDNLYASYVLVPTMRKKKLKDFVIAAPDKGGMPRAAGYAKLLGTQNLALVYKQRDIHTNDSLTAYGMIGDVKGKDVIVVDDMLDSGGTLMNAIDHIAENGARDIYALISHGIFTGEALKRLSTSPLKEVFITDSISHRSEVAKHPKVRIVSVADMIAGAITRIQTGESISESLILRAPGDEGEAVKRVFKNGRRS